MIEVAKTPSGVVIVCPATKKIVCYNTILPHFHESFYLPFGIQFLDTIKSVLAQLDFGCGWAAPLVFIGRNIYPMRL